MTKKHYITLGLGLALTALPLIAVVSCSSNKGTTAVKVTIDEAKLKTEAEKVADVAALVEALKAEENKILKTLVTTDPADVIDTLTVAKKDDKSVTITWTFKSDFATTKKEALTKEVTDLVFQGQVLDKKVTTVTVDEAKLKIEAEKVADVAALVEALKAEENKILKTIVRSDLEGAIATLNVEKATEANSVKISWTLNETFTSVEGAELFKEVKDLVFKKQVADQVATITINKDLLKIEAEKVADVTALVEALKAEENKILKTIVTSDLEGAIATLNVEKATEANSVKISWTLNKGFVLAEQHELFEIISNLAFKPAAPIEPNA